LKNGQLHEKSLFETPILNNIPKEDSGKIIFFLDFIRKKFLLDEEEPFSSPPISRRLAFIGEFNSTPYVLVSPRVQKQLMYDARKNTSK